jgi:hypothetical protein
MLTFWYFVCILKWRGPTVPTEKVVFVISLLIADFIICVAGTMAIIRLLIAG